MAVIQGDDGDNILVGGEVGETPTDDTLNGFLGNDTYLFSQFSGLDVVNDTGGTDQIRFDSTVSRASIRIMRSGIDLSDLIIAVVDEFGNSLTEIILNEHYEFGRMIESILFDNGSRLDLRGGLAIQGWAGVTTVRGTDFNDTITSRAVSETLLGGIGNDTYLLNATSGNDTLYDEGGTDVLRFDSSVPRASLRMVRSGLDFSDLVLAVVDADGNAISQILLDEHFNPGTRFETAIFSNGNQISLTGGLRIQGWGNAATVRGTDLNDLIVSNANSELLLGGTGDDAYLLSATSGNDVIYDESGNDSLRFDSSVTPATLRMMRWGNDLADLVLAVVDANGNALTEIRLDEHFSLGTAIESLRFSDGALLNLTQGLTVQGWGSNATVRGTDLGDTLISNILAETLLGGTGNDTYSLSASSGDDVIFDSAGFDTIRFDSSVAPGRLRMMRSGNDFADLFLAVVDGNGNALTEVRLDEHFVHSSNLERIVFFNGNQLDLTGGLTVRAWGGITTLRGTDLNDVLISNALSETLLGGTGNDTYRLAATSGNDVIFDSGGSDRIQFDASVTQGTLRMMRSGSDFADLWLAVVDANGTALSEIRLDEHFVPGSRIESVLFSNGAQLNLTGGLTVQGWGNAPTVRGTDLNDVLVSNAYSETLLGGTGNDTYRLSATSGNDVIRDDGGIDRILFDASVPNNQLRMLRSGADSADLILAVVDANGNAQSEIVLDEHFVVGSRIESVRFASGAQLDLTGGLRIQGWGTVSVIRGTDNDDNILSNRLNETLIGGLGDDTFIFNPVSSTAVDRILDFQQGGDVIRFSAAFGLSDIDDLVFTQNSGSVTIRAGNQLIVVNDALISDFDPSDFLFA
ncbi:calcium-binding protein [Fertoebacter nigrum]|uniref:Calcium-binding protein n=1 Tax=Fertoeibacter niger TaxID=2656921 RepID=A0A8X8H2J5_9RHOB|nr:calcium-binding protein [Fertoeibacter niger]NUB45119.1 calcium-binding protein [Fertoeibacter niger]